MFFFFNESATTETYPDCHTLSLHASFPLCERLWRALTPQLFRRLQLARALEAARDAGIEITDESMAMERQGHRPLLVEGADDNFKVTTPADLARFEFILSQRSYQRTLARPRIPRHRPVPPRFSPTCLHPTNIPLFHRY